MKSHEFEVLVSRMREAQNQHAISRTKETLAAAQKLEKQVDDTWRGDTECKRSFLQPDPSFFPSRSFFKDFPLNYLLCPCSNLP